MASIHKEILIDASPDEVWAAIRDYGAVHERLGPGFVVDTRLDEDARIVTFASGLVLREVLVDLDDEARRVAYTSVEGRATHHNASMQVFPDGAGGSRLIWITDVLPHELEGFVRELVEQSAPIMKRTLEARSTGRLQAAQEP